MTISNPSPLNIVVIGASSAVAQATIRIWAARGHSLTLLARNADELERIAADARVRGATVQTIIGDATDWKLLQSSQARIVETDIALIAHGVLTNSVRAETDLDYLADSIASNFTSAVLWTQSFATQMSARKRGSIAVISSVAGDRGRGSNHAYGAAKAGLSAFCSGLRARVHKHGVHVLTIKPGFIDTPMAAHIEGKGLLWATPEHIAAGIVRAIEQRRDIVYLPGFWRLILLVVRLLPEVIFKRVKF